MADYFDAMAGGDPSRGRHDREVRRRRDHDGVRSSDRARGRRRSARCGRRGGCSSACGAGTRAREPAQRLEIRIGVNTGEVIASGAPGGDLLVTGDAVNVAARLQQVAEPGTIVVGDRTARAARPHFELRAIDGAARVEGQVRGDRGLAGRGRSRGGRAARLARPDSAARWSRPRARVVADDVQARLSGEPPRARHAGRGRRDRQGGSCASSSRRSRWGQGC